VCCTRVCFCCPWCLPSCLWRQHHACQDNLVASSAPMSGFFALLEISVLASQHTHCIRRMSPTSLQFDLIVNGCTVQAWLLGLVRLPTWPVPTWLGPNLRLRAPNMQLQICSTVCSLCRSPGQVKLTYLLRHTAPQVEASILVVSSTAIRLSPQRWSTAGRVALCPVVQCRCTVSWCPKSSRRLWWHHIMDSMGVQYSTWCRTHTTTAML
jgi:hypothetical protein